MVLFLLGGECYLRVITAIDGDNSAMKIHFLGANRQVTGSCYCLEAAGQRLLIDCGLYQERKFLRRNWEPLPISASSINAIV